MKLPDKFSLTVERGGAGLWYVTSPDFRGLLVAEPQPFEALNRVPNALEALEQAKAIGLLGDE